MSIGPSPSLLESKPSAAMPDTLSHVHGSPHSLFVTASITHATHALPHEKNEKTTDWGPWLSFAHAHKDRHKSAHASQICCRSSINRKSPKTQLQCNRNATAQQQRSEPLAPLAEVAMLRHLSIHFQLHVPTDQAFRRSFQIRTEKLLRNRHSFGSLLQPQQLHSACPPASQDSLSVSWRR